MHRDDDRLRSVVLCDDGSRVDVRFAGGLSDVSV